MKIKVKRQNYKKRKNSLKKKNFFVKFLSYLFYNLNAKSIIFILIAFVVCIFIYINARNFQKYSEKILPTSINIEINNSQIYSLLNEDMYKALLYAKKTNEKRSHFLNRVNNILFSYDQIDEYWIRLGFDSKLQISATPQIPILILETKTNDKYVISSTYKIIAKNPSSSEYLGLYNLSAPEIKLTWKPKSTFLKNKKGYLNNTKLFTQNKNPVNLPWLVNQTKNIYSNFQKVALNYFLHQVIWNSTSGFQLNIIASTPSATSQTTKNSILVFLGKENLATRIERLKILLNDLERKNLFPTEIHLDYSDKASFKVSPVL